MTTAGVRSLIVALAGAAAAWQLWRVEGSAQFVVLGTLALLGVWLALTIVVCIAAGRRRSGASAVLVRPAARLDAARPAPTTGYLRR